MSTMMFFYTLFVLIIDFKLVERTRGEIVCSENCLPVLDADTASCNLTTGVCLTGCNVGYTGDSCTVSCVDHCLNCSVPSNGVNTVCHKCRDSYYRKNDACATCRSTCLTNSTSPLPVCRESDGNCVFGCVKNYFGTQCNFPCSAACTDRDCHRDTGACIKACATDFLTGDNCNKPCNQGCAGNTCEQSGDCKQGCGIDTWGSSCNGTCSSGCNGATGSGDQRVCNVTDGTCLYGCKHGTWSYRCEYPCSINCSTGSCSPNTGDCTAGCVSGTWGAKCESPCHRYCQNNSCSRTGECTHGCSTDTVHGSHCNVPCDVRCQNSSCERDSGQCKLGCVIGYHGDGCKQPCHVTCLSNDCDDVTGACRLGCVAGWKGVACNETCSPYCANNTCDWRNGTCQCKEGLIGALCIHAQSEIIEEKEDEGGASIPSLVFIFVGVLLVAVFIIFLLFLARRRH